MDYSSDSRAVKGVEGGEKGEGESMGSGVEKEGSLLLSTLKNKARVGQGLCPSLIRVTSILCIKAHYVLCSIYVRIHNSAIVL